VVSTSTYTNLLYLTVGLLLLCSVGVVWRRQLGAGARLLAVQGTALALLPLLGGVYRHEAHLLAITPVILALRAVILPWLIHRMVPKLTRPAGGWTTGVAEDGSLIAENREPKPLLSTSLSLLTSAALTVLAYAVCRPLVTLDPGPGTHAAPAALAVILIGVLALVTRRSAFSQVIGFLTLDNGIVALAFLLTSGVPLVVELGGSLDVLLAVLVTAALTTRIQAAFGGTDIAELAELRE
jgi:hydrogenase-4 component E